MIKSIETPHMNRLFPFEFFDELDQQLSDYIIYNLAFIVNKKQPLSKEKRKKLYKKSEDRESLTILHQNNIIEIEPYGEILILDNCVEKEYIDRIIKGEERSQIPMSILICQLYDKNDKPVFSKHTNEKTIQNIPEILWDDPQLMLSVITLSDCDDPTMAILKIPPSIEAKLFEKV